MKVTLRSNGTVQIFLEPENAIEHVYVATIVERVQKGGAVKVDPLASAKGLVISMEE